VGIEALGRLARGALDFGLLQLRRNCAHDTRSNLVLQIKNVLECAIEAIRPEMSSSASIDELTSDTHPIHRLAHAALEHIAHAQVATHLLHVHSPALVREAR